jgi:hypothetical protein
LSSPSGIQVSCLPFLRDTIAVLHWCCRSLRVKAVNGVVGKQGSKTTAGVRAASAHLANLQLNELSLFDIVYKAQAEKSGSLLRNVDGLAGRPQDRGRALGILPPQISQHTVGSMQKSAGSRKECKENAETAGQRCHQTDLSAVSPQPPSGSFAQRVSPLFLQC